MLLHYKGLIIIKMKKTLRENSFKMRVENDTRKVNKRSILRAWRWRRAGWWWRIELIRNTKSRRKIVPQARCGMPVILNMKKMHKNLCLPGNYNINLRSEKTSRLLAARSMHLQTTNRAIKLAYNADWITWRRQHARHNIEHSTKCQTSVNAVMQPLCKDTGSELAVS